MPRGERDPEMHQTKNGNQWSFGMTIHIGADVDSGAAHSVRVTAANHADISELPNLLRENDQVVFGDAGYASNQYKRRARALGMVWRVQDKAKPKGRLMAALSGSQKKRNRRNEGGQRQLTLDQLPDLDDLERFPQPVAKEFASTRWSRRRSVQSRNANLFAFDFTG
jgi:IS5 family transposase